jgi:hypothetical protein
MRSVFIATPTYDEWVSYEYAASLLETGFYLGSNGIGLQHCILPGNPFLDMARNKLVEQFLESDATDLLFIDADVGWDAKAVIRVLSHPQEVVGGLVPKRDPNSDATFHMGAMTGVMGEGCEGNFLFQSLEIPTAFLRIKRSAFERLQKHGVGTPILPYFKIGHKPGDFGEDIYFCRRWIETGQYLWIDSDIKFSHRGGKAWKGNFYDHLVATGKLTVEKAA